MLCVIRFLPQPVYKEVAAVKILNSLCMEYSNSKVYQHESWNHNGEPQFISRFNLRELQEQRRHWKTWVGAVLLHFSSSSFSHPCISGAEPDIQTWWKQSLESKKWTIFTWTWTFSFLETRSWFISFSLISPSSCLLLLPSSTLPQQIKNFARKPPECVHVGVEEHLCEGDEQVEDQPDLHHLHIGGGWQGAGDCNLKVRIWSGLSLSHFR